MKITMPWRWLALCMQDAIIWIQGTRGKYYLPISYAYYPKAHHWVRCIDTHPSQVDLDKLQWIKVLARMQSEIKYRKGQYILQGMKKIQGNGCILAAHQFKRFNEEEGKFEILTLASWFSHYSYSRTSIRSSMGGWLGKYSMLSKVPRSKKKEKKKEREK